MTRPSAVSSELQLRLVVPGSVSLPVRAGMHFDVADPYAVHVEFQTGEQDAEVVPWTFARSLLSDGITAPAGEGDVRVWPATSDGSPVICLSLTSPSGRALFEVPLAELAGFLAQTFQAVPVGGESDYVDVEGELARLLWAEPGA
jgi:hypothetical protein